MALIFLTSLDDATILVKHEFVAHFAGSFHLKMAQEQLQDKGLKRSSSITLYG